MKIKLITSSILIIMLTACSVSTSLQNGTAENLESKITALEVENKNLKDKLEETIRETEKFNEGYREFINSNQIALKFTKAYLDKNLSSMKKLVTSDTVLEDISFLDSKSEISYKINSFSYENKTMWIQVFLVNEIESQSCGFLNLTLKEIEDSWKIASVERDI